MRKQEDDVEPQFSTRLPVLRSGDRVQLVMSIPTLVTALQAEPSASSGLLS